MAANNTVKLGIITGSILGLRVGLYRYLDCYGLFVFSLSVIAVQIMKTMFLGIVCNAVISFAELKANPRAKSTSCD